MLLGRVAPTCEASLAILLPHLPIDGLIFVETMFRAFMVAEPPKYPGRAAPHRHPPPRHP
jgi:hypothetical protein